MTRYPYLDLSVLPGIGELVVSARAAIIITPDLDQLYWANGEGMGLLGTSKIGPALEGRFTIGEAARRQIIGAIDRLEDATTVNSSLRIRQGFLSKIIGFRVSKVELPDGEVAVLLATEPLHGRAHTKANMAAKAVSSLDGLGHVSAVLEADGTILGMSRGFQSLDLDPAVLAGLVEEVASEDDRLVKRLIKTDHATMAAGIARINDDPAMHLLILAREQDEAAVPQSPSDGDEAGELKPELTPNENQPQPANDAETDMAVLPPVSSLRQPSLSTGDDVEAIDGDIIDEPKLTDVSEGNMSEEMDRPDTPGEPIKLVSGAEGVGDIADADLPEEREDESKQPFKFDASQGPVRFAWRMNAKQKFTSVTADLARVVGPVAANIEGLRWRKVAKRLGLDQDKSIKKALTRQDTWSGKTVLWPVQETELLVPVDLAGLPAFSKKRKFGGYHGFGSIRPADAIVDPKATGMKLVGKSKGRAKDEAEEPILVETGGEDDTQLANPGDGETIDETHGEANNGNVVDLNIQRANKHNRRLSEGERAAFAKIGDKLSDEPTGSTQHEVKEAETETKRAEELDAIHKEAYLPSAFAGLYASREKDVDTSILAKLPIAVLIFKDHDLLFCNQDFTNLTGYQDIDDLRNDGGIETLLGSSDNEQDGFTRIRHKQGEFITVKANLQSVPWHGRRVLLLALKEEQPASDVGDPKNNLAENEVANTASAIGSDMAQIAGFGGISNAELSGVLDTATDGVVVLDDGGEIRSVNKAAEALFGYSAGEVNGKDFTHLLARESHRTARDYLAGLTENTVASLLNDGREMIGKEAQGGLIPLFVTMGRLEESHGLCAVMRDITQWKKAEEDLVAAKRQAELASDQKTEFLAKVSHEIRTPLNAIIGFSEVMLEERFGKIPIDRYREYLRDINRSGTHVLELVNDLLDISKIEAGKLELDFSEVKMNDIIAEGVALSQPQANRDQIIIRTSLSGAVPPVVADPRSIRQIILNLVSNAIKYTKSGGQVIVSTVYEETGEVVLRVRDTGLGMSETEITTALMPFRRVQTAAHQRGEGTGLGLPLTKALVEANRAQFSIESTPGEGTLVEIFFPPTRVLTE